MKGQLNWIFTAITDTIAWNILPAELFHRIFRNDLLAAALFRNFLLAVSGCADSLLSRRRSQSLRFDLRVVFLGAHHAWRQLHSCQRPSAPASV